jgi:hypothetical protein
MQDELVEMNSNIAVVQPSTAHQIMSNNDEELLLHFTNDSKERRETAAITSVVSGIFLMSLYC